MLIMRVRRRAYFDRKSILAEWNYRTVQGESSSRVLVIELLEMDCR